ncbi:AAA family ATPase [Mesorhizobium sp. M0563]|uniref:ATP-dependent nuclease n=1 Tax=Mesorhizobium sp. M0563 TaxID=2956959 RepID=UPI003336BBC4
MAKIRVVEISRFRAIRELKWLPAQGVNCLIGPGDSGKSSILEAIDLCLGARRSVTFCDADFHALDTSEPITVSLTIGDLDDSTKSLDIYGQFLRGFNSSTGEVEDEPDSGLETVVTLVMTVGADLDPQWALHSDRSRAAGATRNLTWGDRQKLAPTRIGNYGDLHLAWRRGSVLHRLADETIDVSAALATVARDTRAAFGDQADIQLRKTLDIVQSAATGVGIDLGAGAKALLDLQAVSFVGGSIALHDGDGVPLSGLGIGSTRLLVVALQREVASKTGIILLDELEHGLEPHRIIRLIGLLGAKDRPPRQQAFVTTHSPAALKEFAGDQLFVVRKTATGHFVTSVGVSDDMQGTIRKYPEAFLAPSVLVCEGASEVGFVRGLSRYLTDKDLMGVSAYGVALVDGGGSSPAELIKRALVFQSLGYRAAVFMDSDVLVEAASEEPFVSSGGSVIRWEGDLALEDALFRLLPDDTVEALINRAIELHGKGTIDANITSKSGGKVSLAQIEAERAAGAYSTATRTLLGQSAGTDGKKARKGGWFKSLGYMEELTSDIVLPCHHNWNDQFGRTVKALWEWVKRGG